MPERHQHLEASEQFIATAMVRVPKVYNERSAKIAETHGLGEHTCHHTTGYDAELDRLRKGPAWQRLSRRVIREQPICRMCDRRISELTDHIVPAREAIVQAQMSGRYPNRNAGYYLRSNLQGLCRPCHFQKTIDDKTHSGPWPGVVEKEQEAPKRRYGS